LSIERMYEMLRAMNKKANLNEIYLMKSKE